MKKVKDIMQAQNMELKQVIFKLANGIIRVDRQQVLVDADGTILYPEDVVLVGEGKFLFDSLVGKKQVAMYKSISLMTDEEEEDYALGEDTEITLVDYKNLESFTDQLYNSNIKLTKLLQNNGIRIPNDLNDLT